jgi:hypothetical protein
MHWILQHILLIQVLVVISLILVTARLSLRTPNNLRKSDSHPVDPWRLVFIVLLTLNLLAAVIQYAGHSRY